MFVVIGRANGMFLSTLLVPRDAGRPVSLTRRRLPTRRNGMAFVEESDESKALRRHRLGHGRESDPLVDMLPGSDREGPPGVSLGRSDIPEREMTDRASLTMMPS